MGSMVGMQQAHATQTVNVSKKVVGEEELEGLDGQFLKLSSSIRRGGRCLQ